MRRPLGIDENFFSFYKDTARKLPVILGGLKAGKFSLQTTITSQFLTGLLFALPLLDETSKLTIENLTSKPYIDMTIETLKQFGIKIENYGRNKFIIHGKQKYQPAFMAAEGDWSGASFLLVAGAITGKISLEGLNIYSSQGDKKILELLAMAGAEIKISPKAVIVSKGNLKPFGFQAENYPDLVLPAVSLAAACKGTSIVSGIKRLRYKESDRLEALRTEFAQLGIKIDINKDTMKIHGGNIKGGLINSRNDHRIAMATVTAALAASGESSLIGVEAVKKSYPDFFSDLTKAGAKIHE